MLSSNKDFEVKPSDNEQKENIVDDKVVIIGNNEIKQINLGGANETIRINNNDIKLKVVNSTLYVNDVKQEDVNFEGTVFATNQYILVAGVGRAGYGIDYAIDKDGKIINVYKSIISENNPYTGYEVNGIKFDDGKVVAKYTDECFWYNSEKCVEKEKKIEFIYDGNNINMVDTSLEKGINALTKFNLTKSNKQIQFDVKLVNLRSDAGAIYFNDKLVKEFEDYSYFGVYVSDKLIFINWLGGQCQPFIGAINENGQFIEIKNDNSYPAYGLYEKDNTIMGTGYECSSDPDGNTRFNAKFVYDGKTVSLIKE